MNNSSVLFADDGVMDVSAGRTMRASGLAFGNRSFGNASRTKLASWCDFGIGHNVPPSDNVPITAHRNFPVRILEPLRVYIE